MAVDIQNKILRDIETILKSYGETIVAAIEDKLAASGKVRSDKIPGSITFNIAKLDSSIKLQILTSDFLNWLENGRKAGKMPPIDSILNWVITKGIRPKGFPRKSKASIFEKQTRMSFAIAKSIAKKGIKPKKIATPIVNKTVNDFTVEIGREINLALSEGIIDEFISAVDSTNKKGIKIYKTR